MIVVRGHLGFGDCIHQRAPIRALMERGQDVVLETFYSSIYHDLRAKGLKLLTIPGPRPRVREHLTLVRDAVQIPHSAPRARIQYNAEAIRKHGSILAAQYASLGLAMPEKPDFSLPVPDEWRQAARRRLGSIGRPLMVYRPMVLNNMFHCEQRLPDGDTYATLYKSVSDRYHVVSVANLGDHGDNIAGREMAADTKFHGGELSGEELIGLYAEADLAFTCAGFAPVLAQAVGTRCVIVYGGHEGFRTTNSVGAHLAATLAIEPLNVCECHGGHYTHEARGLVKPARTHECDKTIDIQSALQKLQKFVECENAYA